MRRELGDPMIKSRRSVVVIVGINCLLLTFLVVQALRDDSWVWRLLVLVGAAGVAFLTGLLVWTRLVRGDDHTQRHH
ncbi:hypothetical protein [Micromonospora sp. WMMD980]|uniref:hypothetical protein n=1 Tax=Micromonospora sp. WMMD980 TaxID=3016088 RepID=UPI00241600F4|nr:hypothetical protein [Micromonospora sp. WMMD980]MDG4801147.1 hypothetical protein [Micromonospora sp. WMMD980]